MGKHSFKNMTLQELNKHFDDRKLEYDDSELKIKALKNELKILQKQTLLKYQRMLTVKHWINTKTNIYNTLWKTTKH